MIVKLNSSHKESLFSFLKKEAEINLFIIGDVELFGFDKDFQEIWAEFDERNEYKAVLLKYRSHFIFYSVSDTFSSMEFASIIEGYGDRADLSGKKEAIDILSKDVKYSKVREQYFAKISTIAELNKVHTCYELERPTDYDAKEFYDLRLKIKEFEDFKTTLEGIKEQLKGEMGRTYIIKLHGKIVSSASTTVENSMSAMVISVMTHPDYRKKGLAAACVCKICEELLSEGKNLCLFYDNPKAGSIYKSLGFKEIGKWTTIFF